MPARSRPRVVQPHRAQLLARLRRIEGQVRGVANMIGENRYCVDILTQLAAIRSALDGAAMQLLRDHTRGCVTKAIRSGKSEEAISELMDVVGRLSR